MNKCTRLCAMNDPDKGCLLGLGDNCTVGPDKEYQRPAEVKSGSVREQLLDLIIEAKKADTEDAPFSEFLADFLVANGVTIIPLLPKGE